MWSLLLRFFQMMKTAFLHFVQRTLNDVLSANSCVKAFTSGPKHAKKRESEVSLPPAYGPTDTKNGRQVW